MKKAFYRRSKFGPQLAYKVGLAPLIGKIVLLLTTTGRKSGLPRVTPLQYECLDGVYHVVSVFGTKADWPCMTRLPAHCDRGSWRTRVPWPRPLAVFSVWGPR
ncbi:MAG: nitroreductase/quinone reductase family protein [Anaerolineales bacterium]